MRLWPNQALRRTVATHHGCKRRASWPPSLSLGRYGVCRLIRATRSPSPDPRPSLGRPEFCELPAERRCIGGEFYGGSSVVGSEMLRCPSRLPLMTKGRSVNFRHFYLTCSAEYVFPCWIRETMLLTGTWGGAGGFLFERDFA